MTERDPLTVVVNPMTWTHIGDGQMSHVFLPFNETDPTGRGILACARNVTGAGFYCRLGMLRTDTSSQAATEVDCVTCMGILAQMERDAVSRNAELDRIWRKAGQ